MTCSFGSGRLSLTQSLHTLILQLEVIPQQGYIYEHESLQVVIHVRTRTGPSLNLITDNLLYKNEINQKTLKKLQRLSINILNIKYLYFRVKTLIRCLLQRY